MNVGGFGEREVSLIADELSRAVELTLNPTVAHDARKQAYTACESFKENSPWCAQAGLLLASGAQYSSVVKHFGLQLMEHTVKYRWTQITQAEKIFIKENAMKLLYMGGWETGHLNDALARVIVEMIKREWPQQWPTLLAELSDACSRGHLHTQIVLHVFLRLVEDVATLQTLEQHQRRKDIYQALTSNMAEIFAFFMRLIELHVQEFREKTASGDYVGAASNGRVVQVVLLTLTGFVEWVSTNHVVTNNGRLLQILCILLSDDVFQLPAAECLLQIVNRKGSTKERKPLMILFSEDAISCIHRAALQSIAAADEPHYLFLKKLSQVLAGLAQQLTSLWNCTTNVESWLPLLLETMLLMTSHPSLTLVQTANTVWLAFLKHEQISKLPHVLAMVPRWLQAAAPKVLKVTYPSSRVSGANDTVAYACMDYDSEQEFAIFFSRSRTEILESFRYCMIAAPLVTWAYVEQWTQTALDKADSCPLQLDVTHPLHVEWEALAQVLDVVLSRLLQAEPRPSVAEGLRLLQRCVACEPRAPLALSLLLSFVSALFVFLSCASSQLAGPGVGSAGAELLPRVLDKIFAALVYEGTPPEGRASRNVKNVRRHAAGLLVKLGCKYPLLLLPVFPRLHELSQTALARPDLSAVESVTLQEALLVISNHFCCYERQSALVAQVLGDCRERWAALSPHLQSAAGLARLVGLDAPPADDDPERARARRTLLHALTLTLGVVKRSQVPADPDKASRGGFGAGVTAAGNPLWRNPCGAHVLPLLPAALALARALHELHAPHAAALRHPGHARALQPPPAERRNLLGLRDDAPPAPPAAPHDRMQNLLHTLHDNVCQLVGAAAASLGRELFGAPGLARALAGSLLGAPERLPDHWLRRVLRAALRPLLLHCPPAHYGDVALPLLQHLAPILLVHLNQRWEYVTSLYESGKLEEEGGSESQEVLEDMLVRHLTREYLELLKVSLVEGGVSSEPCADMDDESPPPNPSRAPEQVSELGALVLADRAAGPAVLHTTTNFFSSTRTHLSIEWKRDRCVTSRTLRPIVPLSLVPRCRSRNVTMSHALARADPARADVERLDVVAARVGAGAAGAARGAGRGLRGRGRRVGRARRRAARAAPARPARRQPGRAAGARRADVRGAAAALPGRGGRAARHPRRGRARPAAPGRQAGRAGQQARQDRQEQARPLQEDHLPVDRTKCRTAVQEGSIYIRFAHYAHTEGKTSKCSGRGRRRRTRKLIQYQRAYIAKICIHALEFNFNISGATRTFFSYYFVSERYTDFIYL